MMIDRVKELLAAYREHASCGLGTNAPLVLVRLLEEMAGEIDALKAGNKQPEIDWQRKFEALQEVHNETHAALAKAGADIHDLANQDHARAIEALIAQRAAGSALADAARQLLGQMASFSDPYHILVKADIPRRLAPALTALFHRLDQAR